MTVRTNRVLISLVVLAALTTTTGCQSSTPAAGPSSSMGAVSSGPAESTLGDTDPALWAVVRFEHAHCSWDWRQPRARSVAAQQALATPAFATQLAAASDPTSWEREVVAEHQVVTCAVTAPRRVLKAPSTAMLVYARVIADSHIVSTRGSFDAGDATASWIVRNVAGRWLVAGTFDGG